MLNVSIQLTPKGKQKLNSQNFQKVMSNTIKELTLEAERQCKHEAPHKTGALKNNISSDISNTEGNVKTRSEYALRIIYGTGTAYEGGDRETAGNMYFNQDLKRYVASEGIPNNFPQRAINTMSSQNMGSRAMKQSLKKFGVT